MFRPPISSDPRPDPGPAWVPRQWWNMTISQELYSLLYEHRGMPEGVDGHCAADCPESFDLHLADHFVRVLVEHYNLPWTRTS